MSDQERTQSGGAQALSSAQLGIWFAQKLNPSIPAYNIGEYTRSRGRSFGRCLNAPCGRSWPKRNRLRLQFSEQTGEPRRLSASRRLVAADHRCQRRARCAERGHDMDERRPGAADRSGARAAIRFRAVQSVGDGDFSGMRVNHHIELTIRHVAGRPPRRRCLQPVSVPARRGRRCAWRADGPLNEDAAYLASEQFEKDRQYWSEALRRGRSRQPDVERPFVVPPQNFLRETAYLPRSCEEALRALAARTRTTLARVMSAAAAIFVHRLTGATMSSSACRWRRGARLRGASPEWSPTCCRCGSPCIRVCRVRSP